MARHQFFPLILFPSMIMKALKQKKPNLILSIETTPMKDVGTTVVKTMIPVECQAINSNGKKSTLPPDSVSHNDYKGPQANNLNLVVTKESTPTKDVGTTVDKTTIPV